MSPDYPDVYPNDFHCEFNVTAPEGYKVSMFFDTMKIQYKKKCTSDYIQVVGIEKFYGVKMCGTKLPPPWLYFKSTDNYMTLTFHTDSSMQLKGFKAFLSMTL